MPVVRGDTVFALLQRAHRRGISWQALRELVAMVKAAADGLAHAHDRGVIHRDVKPQNLMTSTHGGTFVLDWGMAAVRAALGRVATAAWQPLDTGAFAHSVVVTVKGTIADMAPEQARGEAEMGPAADVYGLGSTLFEVLAGAAPRTGSGRSMAAQAREGRRPTWPPAHRAPAALVALTNDCLHPNAKERPTAATLALRLGL